MSKFWLFKGAIGVYKALQNRVIANIPVRKGLLMPVNVVTDGPVKVRNNLAHFTVHVAIATRNSVTKQAVAEAAAAAQGIHTGRIVSPQGLTVQQQMEILKNININIKEKKSVFKRRVNH